jgi:hypothetical protein
MVDPIPECDPTAIKTELYAQLPMWASELITSDRYADPSDPYRQEFADNPDSQSMHSYWHQWGIVGHTVMAGKAFDTAVPQLLAARVESSATNPLHLREEGIDGMSKWGLLGIAIVAHDYGKFTERQYTETSKGPMFGFREHEAESGVIVRAWHERFAWLGLTDRQIEYVARCAELHFELGKLRLAAQQSGSGYTITYTTTPAFKSKAQSISESYTDFRREIGIMFLADNLAKTDVLIGLNALTDKDNEALYASMEKDIVTRGLSRALIPAARQVAVNIAVGTEYLNLVVD